MVPCKLAIFKNCANFMVKHLCGDSGVNIFCELCKIFQKHFFEQL